MSSGSQPSALKYSQEKLESVKRKKAIEILIEIPSQAEHRSLKWKEFLASNSATENG